MPCDVHEQELETQSCCCIVDVRAYSAFFNINVKVTTTTDERPRAFRLAWELIVVVMSPMSRVSVRQLNIPLDIVGS